MQSNEMLVDSQHNIYTNNTKVLGLNYWLFK